MAPRPFPTFPGSELSKNIPFSPSEWFMNGFADVDQCVMLPRCTKQKSAQSNVLLERIKEIVDNVHKCKGQAGAIALQLPYALQLPTSKDYTPPSNVALKTTLQVMRPLRLR